MLLLDTDNNVGGYGWSDTEDFTVPSVTPLDTGLQYAMSSVNTIDTVSGLYPDAVPPGTPEPFSFSWLWLIPIALIVALFSSDSNSKSYKNKRNAKY